MVRRPPLSRDPSAGRGPGDPPVGRSQLFESILDAYHNGARVVCLYGPGGIGKTRLAQAIGAADPEIEVVDDVGGSPDSIVDRLRAGGKWVLTTRSKPGSRWAAALDPGAFLAIPVNGLTLEGVASLLEIWKIQADPAPWHAASHGHPLLLIGMILQANPDLAASPALALEVTDALDAQPCPSVPREVLWLCALLPRVRPTLLRQVTGLEEVGEAVTALGRRGWVEISAAGLEALPVARDVILLEAQWRDPEALRGLKSRLVSVLGAELAATPRAHGVRDLLELVDDPRGIGASKPKGTTTARWADPSEAELAGAEFDLLGLGDSHKVLVIDDWDGHRASLVPVLFEALGEPALGAIAFRCGGQIDLHDLRWLGVQGWLRSLILPLQRDRPVVHTHDRPGFDEVVRSALRVLARSHEDLPAQAFARCRIGVRETFDADPACHGSVLGAVLQRAMNGIADPRARRAMERTYSPGAPKQFAIANELGLSFATYRRALNKGMSDVLDQLWATESAT